MQELKGLLDKACPAELRSDAILIAARLLPLTLNCLSDVGMVWPFGEAIDQRGRLMFYPQSPGDELPQRCDASELAEFLRLGTCLGAFRSVGLVDVTPLVTILGKSWLVSLDMCLRRQMVVTVLTAITVDTNPRLTSPIILGKRLGQRSEGLD